MYKAYYVYMRLLKFPSLDSRLNVSHEVPCLNPGDCCSANTTIFEYLGEMRKHLVCSD